MICVSFEYFYRYAFKIKDGDMHTNPLLIFMCTQARNVPGFKLSKLNMRLHLLFGAKSPFV